MTFESQLKCWDVATKAAISSKLVDADKHGFIREDRKGKCFKWLRLIYRAHVCPDVRSPDYDQDYNNPEWWKRAYALMDAAYGVELGAV